MPLIAPRRPSRAKLAGLFAIIAVGAAGCTHHADPPDVVVDRLMRCVECVGGERSAVVGLHDTAVAILSNRLLSGPPADHITRLQQSLTSLPHPPSAASLALAVDEFRAMYQMRSADALGAIATDSAKHALCVAHSPSVALPADVKLKVNASLANIGGPPCP